MKITTKRLHWHENLLEEIAFPARAMRISRGLGSGLARCASDAPGLFWAIGDRGPNIKVKVAIQTYGLANLQSLADVDGAKIMPSLNHGPTLFQLSIIGDAITLLQSLPLRGRDGTAIGGLPPPSSPHAEHEPMYGSAGDALGTSPSGVDSEAVAALADGSFWIGEEYGPSLLKVDRHGQVLMRWVPAGTAHFYTGAKYPVVAALPALAAARRLNRGFEALALSPCQRWLYVMFQSPLAHPDRAAHESSRHVRLWKLDAQTGACVAEYIYPLDKPSSFKRDSAIGDIDRSDIKVSEALMLADNRLLILERASASTKFYAVDLRAEHETPPQFINPAMRPTIEQMSRSELRTAGVQLLHKQPIFDTDDFPEICADLEGMILLSPRTLLLVNDNDFGVEDVATAFWRIDFDSDIV
jgi:hypothetical protein